MRIVREWLKSLFVLRLSSVDAGAWFLLVGGFSNDLYGGKLMIVFLPSREGGSVAKTAVELLCRPNHSLMCTTWAI
jgi:hypothetical protein